MENQVENLTFYVVKNKEGKFLRSKGYNGYGECWVSELKKAKVWTKLGTANAQVTWWASTYPEYGIPDVIPLYTTMGKPLNQDDRVAKAIIRKELRKFDNKIWDLKRNYDKANRELERHKSEYARIRFNEAKEKLETVENKINELKNKLKKK